MVRLPQKDHFLRTMADASSSSYWRAGSIPSATSGLYHDFCGHRSKSHTVHFSIKTKILQKRSRVVSDLINNRVHVHGTLGCVHVPTWGPSGSWTSSWAGHGWTHWPLSPRRWTWPRECLIKESLGRCRRWSGMMPRSGRRPRSTGRYFEIRVIWKQPSSQSSGGEVANHPFFWDDRTRLNFLITTYFCQTNRLLHQLMALSRPPCSYLIIKLGFCFSHAWNKHHRYWSRFYKTSGLCCACRIESNTRMWPSALPRTGIAERRGADMSFWVFKKKYVFWIFSSKIFRSKKISHIFGSHLGSHL